MPVYSNKYQIMDFISDISADKHSLLVAIEQIINLGYEESFIRFGNINLSYSKKYFISENNGFIDFIDTPNVDIKQYSHRLINKVPFLKDGEEYHPVKDKYHTIFLPTGFQALFNGYVPLTFEDEDTIRDDEYKFIKPKWYYDALGRSSDHKINELYYYKFTQEDVMNIIIGFKFRTMLWISSIIDNDRNISTYEVSDIIKNLDENSNKNKKMSFIDLFRW